MKGTTEVASGTLLRAIDDNTNASYDLLLATVDLTTTQITYDIYLWLDINLSGGEYHNKSFSGKIYAKAEQSSTIR